MNSCRVCIFVEPKKLREDFRNFLHTNGFQFYIYDPVLNQRKVVIADVTYLFKESHAIYECIYNGTILDENFFQEIFSSRYLLNRVTIELS